MKSTENFKKVILQYLEIRATNDTLFAQTLKKENKNIDDCITYILNQVKNSGCNGFEDDEIFGIAVHYYDEDDVVPGSAVKCNIITNHQVELTEEEIKEAKEKALNKVVEETKAKMTTKKTKAKVVENQEEPNLFNL